MTTRLPSGLKEKLKASYAKQLSGGQIKANARVAENLSAKLSVKAARVSPPLSSGSKRERAGRRPRSTSILASPQHEDFIEQCMVEERARSFTRKIGEMAARSEQEP